MVRVCRLGQEAGVLVAALLLSASLAQSQDDQAGFDVLDFIDPFIGTANGGHSFAGATLPFGDYFVASRLGPG
jgi:putative alpha-1,2-mannosidase